jgi:hypothetical protein
MSISPTRAAAAAKPAAQPKQVVFRGNLDIYNEADLAKLKGVTHIIGDVTVQVPGKLSLPALVKVEGNLNLGSDGTIELANLKAVTGSLSFAGGTTTSIKLPALEIAKEGIGVSSMSYPLPKLKTLELPRLRETKMFMTQASGLKAISLPALKKIGTLQISDTPSITTIALPKLQTVDFYFSVNQNPKMTTKTMGELAKALTAQGVDKSKLMFDRGL